jgi:hypothetical protein
MLYNNDNTFLQFWVWSLTTLRKKFFEFTDRLSFERSSFLFLNESQTLLRLKCVRSLLKILRKQPQQVQKIASYEKLKHITMFPNESVYLNPHRKIVSTVSIRIKDQQEHLLEQSFTSYLREFENTSLSRDQIFQKFQYDILNNLKRINDHSDNPKEEVKHESIYVEEKEEPLEFTFELHDIDFCYQRRLIVMEKYVESIAKYLGMYNAFPARYPY